MDINSLDTILEKFISFLSEVNEKYWMKKMQDIYNKHDSICSKIMEVMKLYGGMGSLGDLCILKANGHLVKDEEVTQYSLNKLRNELYTTARKLKEQYGC